jgi:RNA polymerase sigma factor (sigma-70 family)
MDPSTRPIDLEGMLENAGWMRALARTLVRDPGDAEDILQETWLEAVRRPPRDPAATGGWLASVLRNFARRRFRHEGRRRAREERAARPEAVEADPRALLEKLELHRTVAGEVARLEEPYRSTIILRFFEDLGVAEIARRQGIPLDTVKTRLRRALAELRGRLDRRHGGDGRSWKIALLPLAGLAALPGAAEAAAAGAATASTPATGAPVTTAATAGAAAPAATAGAAAPASWWTLLTTGGLIMTQKTILAVLGAGLIAAAVGWGIGRGTAPTGEQAAIDRYGLVSRAEHDALRARCEAAETSLARAKADAGKAASAKEALAAKLSALEGEAKAAAGKAGKTEEPAGKDSSVPVAELEEVRKADWKGMALALGAMHALFHELQESQKEGKPLPADWKGKMMEQNDRLRDFALKLLGKIPTQETGNGEFTHPFILSSLMTALLENQGRPLTDAQKAEVAALAGEYDAQYGKLQKEYGEDTPRLEKFVDELDLKRTTVNGMREVLAPEQRDAIVPADLRDRIGFDLLSPLVMAQISVRPKPGDSADAVKAMARGSFAEMFGLDAAQTEQAAPLFEAWGRDLEPLLEPGAVDPKAIQGVPALAAARAQLKLMQGLLEMPGLTEASRTAILRENSWLLPVVQKKKEPAPEGAKD